jgi:polysaccharide biosynthesis transport protein
MTIDDNTPLLPDGDETGEHTLTVQPAAVMGTPLSQPWLPGPAAVPAGQPSGVNMLTYLHALRRHWLAALASGVLCGAVLGVAGWFVRGPKYEATALLHVTPTQRQIVFQTADNRADTGNNSFEIYKATQALYLKSRFVLMAALRNPRVKNLSCIQREEQQHNALAWLTGQLSINSGKDTEVMAVSVAHGDPEEAAVLVNAVVQAYFDEVVNVDRRDRRGRLDELQRVYSEIETRARAKRADLKALAEQLGGSDNETLSLRQQIAVQQFAEYRRELTRLRFEVARTKGQLQAQQALLDRLPNVEVSEYEVLAFAQSDPRYRPLAERMVFQESMKRMNDNYAVPGGTKYANRASNDLNVTQAQFEEIQKGLRDRIRGNKRTEIEREIRKLEAEIAILGEQERQFQKDVDQQRKEVDQLGRGSIDVEMMRADQKRSDVVLNSIAEERERLSVEMRAQPRVSPIRGEQEEAAQVPETESNRSIRIMLAILSALAGMFLPAAGLVLWDMQSKRISTAEDISKGLGLQIMGSVPLIPANVIRRLGSDTKRNQTWRVRLTESVDGLAARLLRKSELEQTRVILVSSAVAGEGKTTLATQLAMSLARNMRRTVLVDFDLRRPALDSVFGLPLENGVCEALRGQADVASMVQATGTDRLAVLTAGRWDRQVLAALGNGVAASLIQELRADYDFVVLDSSPVLPIADTRLVSQHVDLVILSVFRDISQGPKVLAAYEILEAFGADNIEVTMTGGAGHYYSKDLDYPTTALAQEESLQAVGSGGQSPETDALGDEQ